jgi:hypothetical protein
LTAVVAAAITGVIGLVAGALGILLKERVDRRREAQATIRRYRDPLLHAAFELQSRIWNIVDGGFLARYGGPGGYGERSTLWVFAQYLGWAERLRRDVQFLDAGSAAKSRALGERLEAIRLALASDKQVADPRFNVFRAEQRAIGELALREEDVVGYASFSRLLEEDADFAAWFDKLRSDLEATRHEERPELYRLRLLQRRLVDLIDLLDPDRVRFRRARERLPLPPSRPDIDVR